MGLLCHLLSDHSQISSPTLEMFVSWGFLEIPRQLEIMPIYVGQSSSYKAIL